VSYQIRFEHNALFQLGGMADTPMFDALLERILHLVDAPWDAHIAAPGDDPAIRETTFGDGRGLISFRVDETAEVIRIFAITWIG